MAERGFFMQERIENNKNFLDQLKRHEGLRLKAYHCTAGALTIGYGHNLDANPIRGLGPTSTISKEEASEILERDCRSFAVQLDGYLTWWRLLSLPRQAVLLNMAFNMGVPTLMTFTNTLFAVQKGYFGNARSGMLNSRWASQVGRRAVELAQQMLTGQWQQEVSITMED